VHAGNGTEEIFWDGTGLENKELLMISTHQNPSYFYPGTGFIDEIGGGSNKGKIVNIPFERYCGDQSMDLVLREIIGPLLSEFEPEFIYFSAGFDGHYRDPVGGLNFTAEGFGNIVKFLEPISEEFSGGRFAFTLEGGYNIKALGRSIVNVINVSTGGSILYEDNHTEPKDNTEFTAKKLIPLVQETLKPYWNCF
jgi:acetoin utilization deacetylase AcuC-like enzyme